jgi:hypothetical protein
MHQASLKFNLVSEDDCKKLQNGIAEVREYLHRTGGNRTDQEYGFHEIAREPGEPLGQCFSNAEYAARSTHTQVPIWIR